MAFVSRPIGSPKEAPEPTAAAVWPPPPTVAPPPMLNTEHPAPPPGLMTGRAWLDAVFGFALGAVSLALLIVSLAFLPPPVLRWLNQPLALLWFLGGCSVGVGGTGVILYRHLFRRWPDFAAGGALAVLLGLLALDVFFIFNAVSQ